MGHASEPFPEPRRRQTPWNSHKSARYRFCESPPKSKKRSRPSCVSVWPRRTAGAFSRRCLGSHCGSAPHGSAEHKSEWYSWEKPPNANKFEPDIASAVDERPTCATCGNLVDWSEICVILRYSTVYNNGFFILHSNLESALLYHLYISENDEVGKLYFSSSATRRQSRSRLHLSNRRCCILN